MESGIKFVYTTHQNLNIHQIPLKHQKRLSFLSETLESEKDQHRIFHINISTSFNCLPATRPTHTYFRALSSSKLYHPQSRKARRETNSEQTIAALSPARGTSEEETQEPRIFRTRCSEAISSGKKTPRRKNHEDGENFACAKGPRAAAEREKKCAKSGERVLSG